jgi:hypothetical protein
MGNPESEESESDNRHGMTSATQHQELTNSRLNGNSRALPLDLIRQFIRADPGLSILNELR